MKTYLSHNLIQLRESKHLTQHELASLLHISPAAYSHYEREQRVPSLETLCDIAEFYGITLDQLVRRRLRIKITQVLVE